MKKFDFSFYALWTTCQIILVSSGDKPKNSQINSLVDYIKNFEKEFSRFLSDSDLMILNTQKKLEVSERFLRLLHRCREMYELSEWYFNPLVDVSNLWYSHSFVENIFEKTSREVNMNFLWVKNYWNLVELQENMFLDFGSIAKGFLADELAILLEQYWYKNFLINMWWDLRVGGKNVFWKKWEIAIQSPIAWEGNILTLPLENKSISTSGTYLRNWEISWEKYHHIITPFWPQTTDLTSVSIIDFYWYKTDALATAVLAMWKEKAIQFLEANKFDYVLIDSEKKVFQS